MNSSEVIVVEEKEEVQNINGSEDFDLDSLPPGYKFCPTDVDLLFYLTKKVHHQTLPPNKIAEVNLYAHHPDQLAAMWEAQGKNEWFYFTPRERKYTNGQRPNRSINNGDGFWKATAAEKVVKSDGRKIGYKRSLVFYQGNHPDGVKTNWLMQEYRVADPPPPTIIRPTDHLNLQKRFDDYVICRVYQKNRSDIRGSKRPRDDIDEPNMMNEAESSSSKIPRLDHHEHSSQPDDDQQTENQRLIIAAAAGGGGGGTQYAVEEVNWTTDENIYNIYPTTTMTTTTSVNNNNILQYQQQQRLEQQQQPIQAVVDRLPLPVPPPAEADVFWDAHNNHLIESTDDFTYDQSGPLMEMPTDFYGNNLFYNSDFCSTMEYLNPSSHIMPVDGGDNDTGGFIIGNSNIDGCSTNDTKLPMPLMDTMNPVQNQHQQHQHQQPIVEMPEITQNDHDDLQVVVDHLHLPPPAGTTTTQNDGSNNNLVMQSADFTCDLSVPWEMSTTDFYNSGGFCSTMEDLNSSYIMPGGDFIGNFYTDDSTALISPMPWDSLNPGGCYMPSTGDMWGNCCSASIDSTTLLPANSFYPTMNQ